MEDLNLKLKGMSCASCANNIERAIQHVPGVVEGNVNFSVDSPKEQMSRRKRRLRDERNFAGRVGFHSSTQPTDPGGELILG